MGSGITDRTIGIIIWVPASFFQEYPGGKDEYLRVMHTLINNGESMWHNTIANIPVIKDRILYCYLAFDNKIQLRCNIAEFKKKEALTFMDGGVAREFPARDWCILTAPVIDAPVDIPQKHFRGFRYTEKLF